MKLLTGKAKTEFLKKVYYSEDTNQVCATIDFTEDELIQNESLRWINTQDERFVNALIIDFFDSVGIYISINREISENSFWNFDFTYKESLNNTFFTDYYETRQQATEEAIKKANEIFNNR